MKDFVAIDFETANGKRSSICSVGAVIVKNGEIVDSFYSQVKPTPNYYAWFCQEVHGLDYCDTDDADFFPEVWSRLQEKIHAYFPFIEDGEVPFVAHNARFDEGCLRAAFAAYDIAYPYYEFECTLIKSREVWPEGHYNLDIIAGYCGYDLTNHHHALADAEACAWIAREIL